MILKRIALPAFAMIIAASPAIAQETTTYTYDALGRVVGVAKSGGPANGAQTTYTYDKAGNRQNVTVEGSPNTGSGGTSNSVYIVVPLNGGTLIRVQ